MNIKETLVKQDFHFKKKFGQNFLIDQNILENIVVVSDVDKETLVIEVGVGAGALTEKLLEKAGFVLGYEIDESLKSILDARFQNENIKIIYDDFLKRDLHKDLSFSEYKKIKIVANLPYYITTPIIKKVIDEIEVDAMIIMVQKEVGDRFSAKPNSKEYGSLTIFLNYHFEIFKRFTVSRNVFYPKPNVDSLIVEFKKKSNPIINNEDIFFKLVKDAFRFKRKTIKNNLQNYDLDKILIILKKYGYDLSVRAESLSMEIFIEIANAL